MKINGEKAKRIETSSERANTLRQENSSILKQPRAAIANNGSRSKIIKVLKRPALIVEIATGERA
jgi:predicted nucleic acid-binding Zn ribbon protein